MLEAKGIFVVINLIVISAFIQFEYYNTSIPLTHYHQLNNTAKILTVKKYLNLYIENLLSYSHTHTHTTYCAVFFDKYFISLFCFWIKNLLAISFIYTTKPLKFYLHLISLKLHLHLLRDAVKL